MRAKSEVCEGGYEVHRELAVAFQEVLGPIHRELSFARINMSYFVPSTGSTSQKYMGKSEKWGVAVNFRCVSGTHGVPEPKFKLKVCVGRGGKCEAWEGVRSRERVRVWCGVKDGLESTVNSPFHPKDSPKTMLSGQERERSVAEERFARFTPLPHTSLTSTPP